MRLAFVLSAAAAVAVFASPSSAQHHPASSGASRSCAGRWTALHGAPPNDAKAARVYQADATAAGLKCVFDVDRPAPPIGETAVRAALDHQLTSATPFVSTPPADIGAVCPHYAELDTDKRLAFWKTFFVAIAPRERFQEPVPHA